MRELKEGAGVVVEATYQARFVNPRDAEVREVPLELIVVSAAVLAEKVNNERRIDQLPLDALALVVKDTQWIRLLPALESASSRSSVARNACSASR